MWLISHSSLLSKYPCNSDTQWYFGLQDGFCLVSNTSAITVKTALLLDDPASLISLKVAIGGRGISASDPRRVSCEAFPSNQINNTEDNHLDGLLVSCSSSAHR